MSTNTYPYINEVQAAIDEIYEQYGDRVGYKGQTMSKFGRNPAVGTSFETIWQRGDDETLPTTNVIDRVSSSDDGDTQDVIIEGQTIASGVFTFVSQTVTLTGQTPSLLTTPLARMTRLYNAGSTNFAGTVYGYENDTVSLGVPQTAAKIHVQTDGANNQTLKAATCISDTEYWLILDAYLGIDVKTSSAATGQLQVREAGGVFRTRRPLIVNSDGAATNPPFKPYLIIRPNSDIRLRAKATSAVSISGAMSGILLTRDI